MRRLEPRARCQRTGKIVYLSDLQEEWTGLRVCRAAWNPRHPQLDVRALPEDLAVPHASPEPEWKFIDNLTPEDLA